MVERGGGYAPFHDVGMQALAAFDTVATPFAFVLNEDRLVLQKRPPESVDDLVEMTQNQLGRAAA